MSSGCLLDTNVLSELMRENPALQVLAWFVSPIIDIGTRNTKDFEGIGGLKIINPWLHTGMDQN